MFGLTAGQDYNIYFINASDVSTVSALASTKSNLTNEEWQSVYNTQYVPIVGDLYLIIDEFCLDAELNLATYPPTWFFSLTSEVPGPTNKIILGGTFTVNIALNTTDITISTEQPSSIVCFPVEAYNGFTMPPIIWPNSLFMNAFSNLRWNDNVSIDHYGWLSNNSSYTSNYQAMSYDQSEGNTTLHVAYGLSTHVPQSSSIQIARVFIIVVIICNLLKTVAIFFTMRNCFSQQILTMGDAVSSYLQSPDISTLGACILKRKQLVRNIAHGKKHEPAQWRRRKVHYLLGVISNGWITYSIL